MQFVFLLFVIWVGVIRANSDLDALLEFRKGIEEDPSGRIFGSWNPISTQDYVGCPLDWYGVQCTGGRISEIALDNIGLVGNISLSALARMSMLQNLSLSSNQLAGVLPPELGSMGSLKFLDLSNNLFSGTIPAELMKLVDLVYLNLSSNNFGGRVPSGFQNLRKLNYLDLRINSFWGKLDDIFAQLQSLIHVDLSHNQFSGSLKSISDNSTINGSLQYLNISYNMLSGELFNKDPMPLFDYLEVFDASFNQLSGNVPSFNFIVSLKILQLRNNRFSGSIPEALLSETSMVLTDLDLSFNQLTGPVKRITSATLKNLNLSFNKLSGSLPISVGSCSVIDLSNNMLSGNLSTVRIWGNYVEVIDLSSNRLKGTLPNITSQFLRLTSFKVSNNLLVGELPLVIGTYPELNIIDLSLNQLYGPLPSSLFTSVRLTNLNLSGNSFTGAVPFPTSQISNSTSSNQMILPGQVSSLTFLDLSNNSLSGSLPQEIASMSGLRFLNVGKNNFSGHIPKEIGLLQQLLYVDLSNNHFEGNIPDDFPDGIVEFNVSYNSLSGIVPSNLLKFPDSSFHPGNELLIFPHLSPSSAPNFSDKGKHGRQMKRAIRYALIACAVACITGILVLLLIHQKLSNRKSRRNDIDDSKAVQSLHFGDQKCAELPPTSINQDQSLSSGSVSISRENRDVPLSTREMEPAIQDSFANVGQYDQETSSSMLTENEWKSSMSLVTSSPTIDPYLHPHQSSLTVCSPDKLAGDLHLFDNSFVFTAEQLSHAPAEIIGRSCHGTSYKATLDNEHVLTVKWLKEGLAKSKKEFAREVKKLGTIRHQNLVSLCGYYWGPREHERIIISKYVDAASLTAHLCESEERKLCPLSLHQRLSVAVDIASCLNFLHNERAIPHGNLKSTNILIQAPLLNTLLTDYSLHRLMTPAGMAEQVLNAGALGYRPPEFANTSKPCPSLKSDVYAFGVILLELLTGKGAGEIISGNPGVVDLTDWVRLLARENRAFECFDRLLLEVDPSQYPPKVLEDVLGVALRCIRSASERPEIRTVFEDLSAISL
ncbi:probable inactive receptor kinase At5g10020 [Typha angustifolia]|uniref:probable inactive receptor kinase At5g10020 n=1 Tax=Typha angustifolia TaxID=59011 RepID=UPI003C2DEF1B